MKFKYLLILCLFFYEFSMGQFPGSSRIMIKNYLSQTYTLNYSISADLSSAVVSAITLNNGQSAVTTSGIIMGSVFPLTLSTVGATITNNGNISGGTYSNTFTGLSQTQATYFVAYATTNEGTSYGNPLLIPQQTVFNSQTGRTWMAYNVGASGIPTSLTDTAGYGFLFQWGRRADGHQIVRPTPSGTTTTIATSTTPSNGGLYIIGNAGSEYYNWINARTHTMWQGTTGGTNNPCPTGFRLPTNVEFNSEITSWSTQNADGAFNSTLRLTYCGLRDVFNNGNLTFVGTRGYYWTRDNRNDVYYYKAILSTSVDNSREMAAGNGAAVRCIKIQ